jgi:hypothetical protein|nr:MAG TPA: hypothetical protein [Caudoviricetes sp.]
MENNIIDLIQKLKQIREEMKALKKAEDDIKAVLMQDERNKIEAEDCVLVKTIRTTEKFNEDAFIEDFKNNDKFTDELKSTIIQSKPYVEKDTLQQSLTNGEIPIDYVDNFVTRTETTVFNIKNK